MPDSGPANAPTAPEPPPSRRRRATRFCFRWLWRGTKAIALLILITLVLGVIWITWTNHRGRAEAQAVRDLLRDRGLEVWPELSLTTTPENQLDDGGRLFLAAGQAFAFDESLSSEAPFFGDADWLSFGQQVNTERAQILQQMLQPNRAALDLARRAADRERFKYRFGNPYPLVGLPGLGQLRHVARWQQIEAEAAAAAGDDAGATDALVRTFRLAESMEEDASLLSYVVRVSIVALAIEVTEDVLSRGELGSDQLTRLQEAARTALDGDRLAAAFEQEAVALAGYIDDGDVLLDTIDFSQAQQMHMAHRVRQVFIGDVEAETTAWWDIVAWRIERARYHLAPGLAQQQAAVRIRFFLEAADRLRAGNALDEAFVQRAEAAGFQDVRVFGRNSRTNNHQHARLQCFVLALEAEKLRLAHGDWPDDIRELVSGQAVPVDPWGQPLRMIRSPHGIRIYTTGPDGEDDQGFARWDDYDPQPFTNKPHGEPDDWRSRLLNPELRGTLNTADADAYP